MTDRFLRGPQLDVTVGERDQVVRSADIDMEGLQPLAMLGDLDRQLRLSLQALDDGVDGDAILLADGDDV